jgi:hypothetical protein
MIMFSAFVDTVCAKTVFVDDRGGIGESFA